MMMIMTCEVTVVRSLLKLAMLQNLILIWEHPSTRVSICALCLDLMSEQIHVPVGGSYHGFSASCIASRRRRGSSSAAVQQQQQQQQQHSQSSSSQQRAEQQQQAAAAAAAAAVVADSTQHVQQHAACSSSGAVCSHSGSR